MPETSPNFIMENQPKNRAGYNRPGFMALFPKTLVRSQLSWQDTAWFPPAFGFQDNHTCCDPKTPFPAAYTLCRLEDRELMKSNTHHQGGFPADTGQCQLSWIQQAKGYRWPQFADLLCLTSLPSTCFSALLLRGAWFLEASQHEEKKLGFGM